MPNLRQAEEHHRDRGPARLSFKSSFVPVALPVFLVVLLELEALRTCRGPRLTLAPSRRTDVVLALPVVVLRFLARVPPEAVR